MGGNASKNKNRKHFNGNENIQKYLKNILFQLTFSE